ncbi:MAG: hypothetical protein FWC23_04250 [Chitinispirillia bacterium]|nr:hypothetical protein [Chitinispirillia bacterium]MCL2268379.1 hypothetical protein [Chitinispirillia bacterium]
MTTVLIILAVLIVLILVSLKFAVGKKEPRYTDDSGERAPIIHMSGIYSIVRKSPREDLAALRPVEAEIRAYLDRVTADINGVPIEAAARTALIKHWKVQTEANLREIETGDRSGVVFYYYDFPAPCPVCSGVITKGNFVTREEIFKNPQIIPPLHLGCTCSLTAHQGSESKLRETVLVGMLPFLEGGVEPELPEWTTVVSLSAPAKARG